jgi:predicted dehydrogenase
MGSFLIVGLGSAGRRHLGNLQALGIDDIGVYRSGNGDDKTMPVSDLRVEMDLDEALASGPDAVIVANPTAHHMPVALAAAEAGCHLLLEKPVSHELEGIAALSRAVASNNLVVLVGYQFRFHPCLRKVRSWIDSGAIGKPILVDAHWGEYLPAWQPWRDYRMSYSARRSLGGGVVLTLSHPVDYLRWLIGEVVSVSAETERQSGLEIDVEDTACLNLRFANGAIGNVSLDYVQRPASHSLRIVGREGVIRWDNQSGVARLDAKHGEQCFPPVSFERNSMFVSEMRHFIGCIAGREEPICNLEDGVQTLRVCLAAIESARRGRRIDV